MPSPGPGKQGPGKKQLSPGRGQAGKDSATPGHEIQAQGTSPVPAEVGERGEAAGLGRAQAACSAANSPSPAPRSDPFLPGRQTQQVPRRQFSVSKQSGSCSGCREGRVRTGVSTHLLGHYLRRPHNDPVRQALALSRSIEEGTSWGHEDTPEPKLTKARTQQGTAAATRSPQMLLGGL